MKKIILSITFLIGINIFLYADFKQVNRVKRSGDTMTGALNMGGNNITKVDGISPDDSDGVIDMNGDVNLNSNEITNVALITGPSGTLSVGNDGIVNINWSTSDNGSGSGLDADLLDSLQGSAYQLQLTTPSWKAYDSDLLDGKNFDAFVSTSGDTMSGELNMGSNKIVSVTDPTADQDAATKKYHDDNSSTDISWSYSGDLFNSTSTYTEGLFRAIIHASLTVGRYDIYIGSATTDAWDFVVSTKGVGGVWTEQDSLTVPANISTHTVISSAYTLSENGLIKVGIEAIDASDPVGDISIKVGN